MKKYKLKAILATSILLISSLVPATIGTVQTVNAEKSTVKTIKKSSVKNPKGVSSLKIDNSKWNYNSDDDVYWQVGIKYSTKPADTKYESMGIYVPGKYMTAKKNSDGTTYTAKANTSKKVNGYTSKTAPIIMPVETPGYAAFEAPTGYADGVGKYAKKGIIYAIAGARGKEGMMGGSSSSDSSEITSGAAPYAVTDLKAAIRYMRYNKKNLAGDTQKIITFGMSGGGAQSALMGATGDSNLYYPYLQSIGAAMKDSDGKYISDATYGSMAWCPITSLDEADEAYEWNMGQFSDSDTRADGTFTKELSNDMAKQYAQYLNKLKLKDENGKTLKLEKSKSGIYTSGSYNNYIKKVIETSLNNFLKDTKFPYTVNNSQQAGGNFPTGADTSASGMGGGMPGGGMPGSDSSDAATYKSASDYIKSLNENGTWVKYNKKTNKATITSVKAFVQNMKQPTKGVPAFDSLDLKDETEVFAYNNETPSHFDTVVANLLKKNEDKYSKLSDWNSDYVKSYGEINDNLDAVGSNVSHRMDMYNPMYYLKDYYDGYGTSKVAKYWRIRTGINQGDTALTVESNLSLALQANKNVKDVDFATVWGLKHTTAERTGSSENNLIKWVVKITK